MLLDIRPDHLKIVQDILQKFVPEREVWAFGSRAKWLSKEYSDLDLCIVNKTPLSFRTLGLLEEAFEDSDLPYKVDVVDWASTSEGFRKIIQQDKVVIQRAKQTVGRVSGSVTRKNPCGSGGAETETRQGVANANAVDVGLREDANPADPAVGRVSDSVTRQSVANTNAVDVGLREDANPTYAAEFDEFTFDELKAPSKGAFAMGPFGSRIKAENFVTEGVPVIKGGNLNGDYLNEVTFDYLTVEKANELAASIARKGDIVVTHRGTLGQVGIIPDNSRYAEYIVSQSQLKLSFDTKRVNPYFIYYFLRSSLGQQRLLANTSQVGVPAIAQALTTMKAIKVLLPNLRTQNQIVATLRTLDDRITLLRETNATLEAIAQVLFKSWFVDFDPVHAKQQGHIPEGMDEAAAALFPDSFEESELGLVPRGWRWAALAEVYEINPQRKLKKGDVAPYLDMASVPTAGHCVEAVIQREMGSGSKFKNGDTLLARITPCLENGKTAFVDFLQNDEIGWGSTEFVVLRPKKPLPEYHAYLLCRHPAFREFAVQSMSGTSGRQRVQNDVLGRYLLVVPTESITSAFAVIVGGIQARIAANHEQAQTLSTLRDTLLPRLISGQLRLPEAEAELEAAAP